MSFHDDTSFSSDETCNNYSLYESSSTPNNCSMSFEEMLTKSIPKPPWHGEGFCSSPIHLTPCSHMDQIKISPCIYREQAGITPPFIPAAQSTNDTPLHQKVEGVACLMMVDFCLEAMLAPGISLRYLRMQQILLNGDMVSTALSDSKKKDLLNSRNYS